MDCIECKTANPEGNSFCGKCGAELGRTLDETIRKKGFRDRQATEMEITESVIERLMKWGRWIGGMTALILAFIAFGVGLIYRDTRAVLDAGKIQIESAVKAGKDNINAAVAEGKNNISSATKDVGAIKQSADDLGKQVSHLRSDINGYKEVNSEMEKLQEQFHGQITNLEKLDLRVHTLETVGPEGPGSLSFTRIGCQPSVLATGAQVAYCAQGSPLLLFQRTSNGDLRPVSSLSSVGFQDTSNGPNRPVAQPVAEPSMWKRALAKKRINQSCASGNRITDTTGFSWASLSPSSNLAVAQLLHKST